MPPEDTDRLYTMLAELRDSVEGYRADLNGRLRYLETAEAVRRGSEQGSARIGRLVLSTTIVASGVAATITFVLSLD